MERDRRQSVDLPAEHMKSGVARTIPSSAAAIALLDSIRPALSLPTCGPVT
jgi:hypothetical protein